MGGLNALLHTGAELPRAAVMAGLVVRIALAGFFLLLAWKNLSGDAQMVADWQRWGYPDAFRRATAIAQVVGALLLIPTATCFAGGVLLAGILLGALATHLWHDPLLASVSPLLFLVLVAGSTVWFRPDLLR
jgi:hypothetical protein